MSSRPQPKSKKVGQIVITTTELPHGDAEHPFPSDSTKSVLSRELAVFQELLSSKTLQEEVLDKEDKQSVFEEQQAHRGDNKGSQLGIPTVKLLLTQNINPTSPMFNATPFAPSLGGPCFANTSQAFWYGNTAPLFNKLLGTARYPSHLKDQYIFFYNHTILPGLGSIPSPTAKWIPHLTHNASPFEPSLAVQNNKQQVGFTFEPIGPLAGTPEDQFNQSLPLAFVSSLATSNICPNINLEWWNHFTRAFFISDSELAAHPSLFMGVKAQPTCFLAFDLPNDEFAPVLKPYLFPHRRALLEGMHKEDLVFEAIRNMPSFAQSSFPALEKVEECISLHRESSVAQLDLQADSGAGEMDYKAKGLSVEMLSFDCISPAQSRLSVYAKTFDTSFASVREIFSLGDETKNASMVEGLKALEKFWASLLLTGEDWSDHESQSAEFLYFEFEVGPGREELGVKVYVPSWTLGISKTGLTRGIGSYFRNLGWDIGHTYRDNIQEVFDGIGGQERGGYTYISFAYNEREPAVTIYCSPKFASSV